jgi:type IV secretory pathway ATPase VirB11/archaellum biosynthesis ATPase
MDGAAATVPPPEPPDSPSAWYAAAVHDQYEIVPGVVATVRDAEDRFAYDVREPSLSADATADLQAVRVHFEGAELRRPRTREGAAERFLEGFDDRHGRIIDRIATCSSGDRRRLEYHALAELKCLEELTPHALDEKIEVGDHADGELVVHLTDYAPASTGIEDPSHLERFSAERIERYTVAFAGHEIPVVRYRERLLGTDPFERKYAVIEPDLLPGDDRLIDECKKRIWERGVAGDVGRTDIENRTELIRDRCREVLSRQLTARNSKELLGVVRHRVRTVLAEHGRAAPPIDERFEHDRIEDLVYHVLRDLVGHGPLTIPIHDPDLEDIEANQIGERIKVVPRGSDREPTNLAFDSESAFTNVVTKLAASDGVELSASRPSAKVNLDPDGVEQTIRCAVALPAISEGGPHVSIRKQAADALTPVDLIENGTLPTELVTLLWMLYEHHGIVLFSGSTGAGKTTLMNAHMPFIRYDDRPVSLDEGSREVLVPHETGVSLTTREHRDEFKNVSIADLMTTTNYLNPDIEVIGEINSAASFETFGEVLQTGHGVLGTTHAESIEALVNRVIEKGLPAYLLAEIDLVVFPERVDGDRHVSTAVELLSEREAAEFEGSTEMIEKDGVTVHYNRVLDRTEAEAWTFGYRHPKLGDPTPDRGLRTLDRLADRTNRSVEAVEAEFHRKHGYVEYLVRDGISEVEALFGFLSDLRTDEAATIERIHHHRRSDRDGGSDA